MSPRLVRAIAVLAALAAMVSTELALPPAAFRACAIVAVYDASAPAPAAVLKSVADLAVSKPVISDAAQSLIGTGFSAPAPSLIERLGLVFDLDWVHPTSADARLAADLATSATAHAGSATGTLDVSVVIPDAEQSARAATALAHALVLANDAAVAQVRRRNDIDNAERLSRLKTAAITARQRLVELGGNEADPTRSDEAAASQVALAQARVDMIHAIIASGSPPMSDGRGVPPSIETLQAGYLDLSRQLAKALETLGERHTTVISLRDELRRSSLSLSTEWRRLERLAEAELSAARERERGASKAKTDVATTRQSSLMEARIAVEVADARVAQAERAARDGMDDGQATRLLADAAVPTEIQGFSAPMRWSLAGLVGCLVFFATLRVPTWRRRFIRSRRQDESGAHLIVERLPPISEQRASEAPKIKSMPEEASPHHQRELAATETPGMSDLIVRLQDIKSGSGTVPTILVAANEQGIETTSAALAIGRAAAAAGRRVLIADAGDVRPDLTAAADFHADPVVIDLFGRLRVGLSAETSAGVLYVAPGLESGGRIASGLVANPETLLIDDLAETFDLLIIDGGRVGNPAVSGWSVDAAVRVASHLSTRDDETFAADLEIDADLLIGTILGWRYVASVLAGGQSVAEADATSAARSAQRGLLARPARTVRRPPASRPIRRRVGGR